MIEVKIYAQQARKKHKRDARKHDIKPIPNIYRVLYFILFKQ